MWRFQLQFAKLQIEDILQHLDKLVENTKEKAPVRTMDFCLDRQTDPKLTHEEDKWEREMYRKWGPKGAGREARRSPRVPQLALTGETAPVTMVGALRANRTPRIVSHAPRERVPTPREETQMIAG